MKPASSVRIDNATVTREARRKFLPVSPEDVRDRGWDGIDVLLVNGDAYVDHPTFGISLLGRWLERRGLRVAILSQPKWDSPAEFKRFGRPRLFVGVSSGTVDSMINNYTANKKPRSDDQYSEGGVGGKRPDYASSVYARLAKEAWPETPVIVGGVEASLRRLAHYDYWQNRVRPSILSDLKAELLVFGMGERTVDALVEQFTAAADAVGGPLSLAQPETEAALAYMRTQRGVAFRTTKEIARTIEPRLTIPSFDEVVADKKKFAKAAYAIEYEASPYNGKRLVQYHGGSAVVVNPPALPLSQAEMDSIYTLPFAKDQHPMYKSRVPAADMIRFSVASTRGCYGGCSFCAITLHQGRIVQSRSEESILNELAELPKVPGFKGTISDIGGPTANMYQTRCKSTEIQSMCRKLSCVHPKVCPQLQHDHTPQVNLLRKARAIPGIKKIHIASGLRYDLSLSDKKAGHEYMKELITHHVGGHLKVAPEHMDDDVLHLMKKPGLRNFDEFVSYFDDVSKAAGKEQYLVPYFISGFPGTTHEAMEKVHGYLREKGWNLQQVQAFIPTPMTLATAMYWTGIDPMTKRELFVAKDRKDRQIQAALLQPKKKENVGVVRRYLRAKIENGKDFGTNDPRTPAALAGRPVTAKPAPAKARSAPLTPEQLIARLPGRKSPVRSVVDVPKEKLGPKLLLDTR
ncbi:MAG: YgiQ family radical SAM protein [Bdellovibrionales bacterium]|nr:YgiQ family radical SAM protein [Bdellovibrionales bacterium]